MTEEGVPVRGSWTPPREDMLRPMDCKKPNWGGGEDAGFTFITIRGYCSTGASGSESNKDQLPIPRLSELPPSIGQGQQNMVVGLEVPTCQAWLRHS